MNTKNLTPALLVAATAGSLFISGCMRDESPSGDDPSTEGTVLVSGRVQGDAALRKSSAGAGVEGALVTVVRIQDDGSMRTVSTFEAKTDAQGRFSIGAVADGGRELIVRAKKEGREWKAVVSAKAEKGKTVACRPLDLESSLEADVLVRARAQADGKASFVDIASAIDLELAAQAETKTDAKAEFEAFLAAQARTEAQVRGEALLTGTDKAVQTRIEKAEEARLEAAAKLEADLDAATDLSAEARAHLDTGFRQAEHQAWIEAGLTLEAATAARESCYQAMAKAGAQATVDAEEKALWLRKIALEHAARIGIAVEAGLKAQGGSEIQLGSAAALSAALETSLQAAATGAAIDSAFLRFRSDCATLKIEIPGIASASHAGTGSFDLSGMVEGGLVDSGMAAEVNGNDTAIAGFLAGLEMAAKAQGTLLVTLGAQAQDSAAAKARYLELYAQALALFTTDLSAAAEFRLVKAAHISACASLRVAAEGSAKAAGASDAAVQALAAAGTTLQASIEASAHGEAVIAAYETYHAAVSACLKTSLGLQAAAWEKADSAVRAEGGARATLQAKLAAAADAEAAARAQVEFGAQVEAEAKAAFGSGLTAPSAAQLKATVQALVLANMCG
jgi:hypothetical protein